ncbi:MAG: MFS transporter [Synechococcales bacterium]|nr:MFS transporter [Synechococcales bacterium]
MMNQSFLSMPQQVWVQAIARSLYQFGSAILLFYMPIVFVNYAHLSATEVGLAIGGGAIAGFVGNLLGGAMTDAPWMGRRGTILWAAILSIAATLTAAYTETLPFLLLANVLFGTGTGLYWTAADAAVMDATTSETRQSAFSVLGLFDNVGFGVGTLLGGLWLTHIHPATRIFAIAAAIFGGLFMVIAIAARDGQNTLDNPSETVSETVSETAIGAWKTALTDTRLMIYLLVNTLFIMYIALVNSNLPLYFVNFWKTNESMVSSLFTWGYVGLGALIQIPVVRLITKFSYLRALMLSMIIWGIGFLVLGGLGQPTQAITGSELLVLFIFAIATDIYKPTSSAWIAELAPVKLRGVYTAIAYQCWALGYIIAPIVGGWALDQPPGITQKFWIAIGISTGLGLLVLQILQQRNQRINQAAQTQPTQSDRQLEPKSPLAP